MDADDGEVEHDGVHGKPPPQAKEIPSEVWPPKAPRLATSCLFCWSIVAAIWMVRDDMRDERIMS